MDEEKWVKIIDALFSGKMDSMRVCVELAKTAPEEFLVAVEMICPEALRGTDEDVLSQPDKVKAIKKFREKYGTGLKEAKAWCDKFWVPVEYRS